MRCEWHREINGYFTKQTIDMHLVGAREELVVVHGMAEMFGISSETYEMYMSDM